MKITDKIKKSHDDIMESGKPDEAEATRLGNLAADAIFGGKTSFEWKAYMKNYASNKKQLERLCGEDIAFTHHPNEAIRAENKRTLAYLLGNGVCTINTRKKSPDENTLEVSDASGTLNYLTKEMRNRLNEGLDVVTEDTFNQ